MLICTRLFNQPAPQSGQWTRASSPQLIRLPLYCTQVHQRFYCPLRWSMTQLVEVALAGRSPSRPSTRAGAQSAATQCIPSLSLSTELFLYNLVLWVNTGPEIGLQPGAESWVTLSNTRHRWLLAWVETNVKRGKFVHQSTVCITSERLN